jgi:uncharacterized membrane protein
MAVIEKTIEVDRPLRTVYDQWTQFEMFPMFMEGVEEVRQLDDEHLFWRAEIAGAKREWNAIITDQIPDQRIAWASTSGTHNAGLVRFDPVGPSRTRVLLQLDFEPEGMTEKVGDKLGFVGRRAERDLERFKHFIEERPAETGEWRGTIQGGRTQPDTTG